MITINVFGEIASSQTQAMMEAWGLPLQSLSADNVRAALEAVPDDLEVTLNIDSVGGDVSEGFKIYDLLRTSGKTIYANIVGGCHSMAVILLLAASSENRIGSHNLRALIHRVYTETPGVISSDDAMDIAEDLLREQSAILDIYVDRTDQPREKLEEVMKQERQLDAREMLELGFISKITPYNTNQIKKRILDGFWKQILTQVGENAAQRVTITENAAASYAAQALTPSAAATYLKDLYYKAPITLRCQCDGFILATQSVYDAYAQSFQDACCLENARCPAQRHGGFVCVRHSGDCCSRMGQHHPEVRGHRHQVEQPAPCCLDQGCTRRWHRQCECL